MNFRPLLLILLIAGALLVLAKEAFAQLPRCYQSAALAEQLAIQHGEFPHNHGLTEAGQLFQVFLSPKTGRFTLVLTRVDGISCVVGSGTDWSLVLQPKPEPGS